MTSRRKFVQQVAALGTLSAASAIAPTLARAQAAKLRVGLMLPYTGTFAALGNAITNGFKLAIEENEGKVGGRDIEYFTVDDESEPAKATDNANRLVQRDKVDVLVGTVHSGVVMAMVKVARDSQTLLIIPNAGANAATGSQCAPNIFRTSFTNWQPAHPMGKVMYDKGHRKVVTLTWKYGAGEESIESFKEAFTKLGGSIAKEMYLPFPNVEFQPFITEIGSLKPDAVFVFFAGGGAVKFTKDYAAAGLKDKIPLYGSGFLTDGTLEAQGASAQGLLTTLHYGDGIENAKNKQFRYAYGKKYGVQADVYAVQGYDAGLLLGGGLAAVKGSFGDKKALYAALEKVKVDSPRGAWTMSRAHNPIQDIYLRRVEGNANQVIGVAWKALEDPARGCKMGA
ncbi:MAG TPA: ABC transporter substrate-binding protein [Casimicrobiaceae bacterium]|jgi:branched-chain amino acid transport system substrate-binding protein|nr:ABC transporter substrate-binding protein [Casimicrobiaceae bacterium]